MGRRNNKKRKKNISHRPTRRPSSVQAATPLKMIDIPRSHHRLYETRLDYIILVRRSPGLRPALFCIQRVARLARSFYHPDDIILNRCPGLSLSSFYRHFPSKRRSIFCPLRRTRVQDIFILFSSQGFLLIGLNHLRISSVQP